MNRYLALGCLGIGLMVSPMLQGLAGSAVPANPKIGVIDIENTLSTTPAGKRANDAFEKGRKAKQSALDKQQEELKKADADLTKQQAVLKPEVYQSKRAELEKRFVDLQQTYVKLERELAERPDQADPGAAQAGGAADPEDREGRGRPPDHRPERDRVGGSVGRSDAEAQRRDEVGAASIGARGAW